jgi:hypothetical protein
MTKPPAWGTGNDPQPRVELIWQGRASKAGLRARLCWYRFTAWCGRLPHPIRLGPVAFLLGQATAAIVVMGTHVDTQFAWWVPLGLAVVFVARGAACYYFGRRDGRRGL